MEKNHETSAASQLKIYFGVFFALLLLTGVTVWVAFVDLGKLNIYVALTIAVVKGLLVALFFMHLIHEKPLIRLFSGAAFLWFLILVVLTATDYFSRDWSLYPKTQERFDIADTPL